MRIETFFETLWEDYIRLAPQAEAILALLSATYSTPISNDHVAFRTFGQSPIDIGNLSTSLHDLGYQKDETYQFEGKKLDAVSFVGPTAESPLIFVSELRWWELPPPCREIIEQIINEMTTPTNYGSEVFTLGRLWEAPSQREYTILATESEYASWLTVHGLHANHFTVSINSLPEQTHLAEVVSLLEASGFILNKSGGVIKGKKDDLLMQASTMAPNIEIELKGGIKQLIPGCYYEFAERFTNNNDELFRGFVTANADKIFESTFHEQQS